MSDCLLSKEDSVETVSRITIAPIILEIICRITGLGFAAVARVTPDRWIACEVRDEISFGLLVGGELKVDSTICHEIRQNGVEVLIDHVAEDEFYCVHHTPLTYGFQSYISVPILLSDGTFFGTLCAIDPNPAALKDGPSRDLFKTYASLISFLIDADRTLAADAVRKLYERCIMSLRAQLLNLTGSGMESHASQDFAKPVRRMDAQILAATQQAVVESKALLQSLKANMGAENAM